MKNFYVYFVLFLLGACDQGLVSNNPPENLPRNNNPIISSQENNKEIPPDNNPLLPTVPDNSVSTAPAYQGGSQGAAEPVKTGNEDGPESRCRNDRQEVQVSQSGDCPHLLYGTKFIDNSLISIDETTGLGTFVATITGLSSVSAIDFSPDGQLYGIGRNNQNQIVLAKINCRTGAAQIVGDQMQQAVGTGIDPSYSNITDINFSSQGQLWAHVKNFFTSTSRAGTLSITSGLFTPAPNNVGATEGDGNGIGFYPFLAQKLYRAHDTKLARINTSTGAGIDLQNLVFPPELIGGKAITDLDNDPLTDILYAAIQNGSGANYLGTLSLTGQVSLISTIGDNSVYTLEGLAINRRYETCDDNTPECVRCKLHETLCEDGLDNDFDGNADCLDTDCTNKDCDDDNPCTTGDTCLARVCTGTPYFCNDYNPCTADSCESDPPPIPGSLGSVNDDLQEAQEHCVFEADANKQDVVGSCETDGKACTVGRCIDIGCVEDNRVFFTEEVNGCMDMNECTNDVCVETWVKKGRASNGNVPVITPVEVPWGNPNNLSIDIYGNLLLDNDYQCRNDPMKSGEPCFAQNNCVQGHCELDTTPELPEYCEDVPQAPECLYPPMQVECVAFTEQPFSNICPNIDNNECTTETCVVGQGCVVTNVPNADQEEEIPATSCDDRSACSTGEFCTDGVCGGGTLVEDFNDSNPCTLDTCDNLRGVTHEPLANNTPAGGPCTVPGKMGKCAEGAKVCMDGQVSDMCATLFISTTEICNNQTDDDCDGLTDYFDLVDCPNKLVFVTAASYTGDLGGIAGANSKCQLEASAQSLPGSYKAWLSVINGPASSPSTTFIQSTVPYYLTDRTTRIADNWADLIDGTIQNTISKQANGITRSMPGSDFTWTATNANGTSTGPGTFDCSNWSAFDFTAPTVGSYTVTNSSWSNAAAFGCTSVSALPLYCFEQ